MNLIPIMRLLMIRRFIMSLALISLVMLASVGLSYSVHFCHGKITGIALYPELVGAGNECSCKEPKSSGQQVPRPGQAINKLHCCKNISHFHKVNLIIDLHIKNLTSVLSDFPFFTVAGTSTYQVDETIVTGLSPPDTPLSPVARILILFLHQLRIPFPEAIS
jgi:hypothetical protein